jgi:hypothetical protein
MEPMQPQATLEFADASQVVSAGADGIGCSHASVHDIGIDETHEHAPTVVCDQLRTERK